MPCKVFARCSMAHNIHDSTWTKVMSVHTIHTINYDDLHVHATNNHALHIHAVNVSFFFKIFFLWNTQWNRNTLHFCAHGYFNVLRGSALRIIMYFFITFSRLAQHHRNTSHFLIALGHFGVLRESAFYVAMYFNNCFMLRLSLRSSLFNCRAPYIGTLGKFFVRLGSVLYIMTAGNISDD